MISDFAMCDYLRLGSYNSQDIAAFHRFVMIEDKLPEMPHHWLQYAGLRRGNRFAGVADQHGRLHGILDVSGADSHDALGISSWFDVKCTRIDVQITIPIPAGYRARDFVDLLRAAEWSGNNRRHRRRVHLVEGEDGLDTVYIGSRHSDRFIRVYVKEDDAALRYLRFEVEYKEERAVAAFRLLSDRSQCASLLLSEVQALPDVFPLASFYDALLPWATGLAVEVPRNVADSDSRYKWFVRTVIPFLESVMNDHELGPRVRLVLGELLES